VMLAADAPVVPLLDARHDLVRVYTDATAVIWVRRDMPALVRLAALAPARGAPTWGDAAFP